MDHSTAGGTATPNTLHYGDNLDILRQYIPSGSVGLIYLDPPFNSQRNYNVLFREKSGEASHAQIEAFTDTWEWDRAAEAAYAELIEDAPANVAQVVSALRQFVGSNDMMAYLVMMAQRLVELQRVLKPTGSLYLHCDPTASHYLKILMDTVFGARLFRNEIVWKRRTGNSSAVHGGHKFGAITDSILFYTKSNEATFHPQYSMTAEGYQDLELGRQLARPSTVRKLAKALDVEPGALMDLANSEEGADHGAG